MSLTRLQIEPLAFIVSLINLLPVDGLKTQRQKTHDYTKLTWGTDYEFELLENNRQAQMTAQGKGVKPGDRIILKNNTFTETYRIEDVEYYSNPSDMWIGLLRKEDI